MEKFLLVYLFAAEAVFLIWTWKDGDGHQKEKSIVRIVQGAVIAVLLTILIAGGRKSYLLLLVVCVIQALAGVYRLKCGREKAFRRGRQLWIFIGCILTYFITLLPGLIFPKYEQPKVTGSYEVETVEYTWEDESRIEAFTDTGENRALTVKVWYPKQAEGSFPLVVFSHGAFGVIDSNFSTCMELASNGYVVASIAHPYHAMFVEDTSGRVTIADMDFIGSVYAANATEDEQTVYEMSREWMKLRTEDENFVLDTILSLADTGQEPAFSLIDKEKIGLFGHSMGGASSVELGRERADIDAVIDLEGTMLGEYIGFKNGKEVFNEAPYRVPVLDVYSKEIYDIAQSLPEGSHVNFHMAKYAECYDYVIFKDAGHLNFTDLPLISPFLAKLLGVGTVDARVCIEKVNEVVLAFFDCYLKNGKLPDLQREY